MGESSSIRYLFVRKDINMEKPTCPYMVSGICYRKGCIYIPHQQCMTIREYKNRLQFVKKKKAVKHDEY